MLGAQECKRKRPLWVAEPSSERSLRFSYCGRYIYVTWRQLWYGGNWDAILILLQASTEHSQERSSCVSFNRTFSRTFFAFQLFWKVHSVICRTAVMWWHLGCHPYLVVASAERSSCVNLDLFMPCYVLVFIEAEIEKLTWNVHEHTAVWLVRRKKQPMCSCFVAWCTSVAKNVLFQVKNVLKNILFFLAIWDSPREVVVQLCLSCNWLWWCDIILIHL